jgi:outer membrane protein
MGQGQKRYDCPGRDFMRGLLVTTLMVSLLLGGCALLDPTDPYAGLPSRSASFSPPAGSSTVRWGKGPVSLPEAVEIALSSNPGLAASAHDVDAAEAQADVATGALLPSVGVVGGYTHSLDDQRLVPARFNGEKGVFGNDLFSADLVVSMPLFTGGRLISEMKAAELLARSADHRLARTREELVFNVSSVFYRILALRKVVESQEFSNKALQEHLKRIGELIDAQKAANVDRLRTEVRIADIEQRLADTRNRLSIQQRVLANLMGVDDREQSLHARGELTSPVEQVPGRSESLVAALENRDDYLAARSSLEAQAKRVDAARAGHWPTVSLQGSYGGRWAAGPSDRPVGTDRAEDVGRVGIVVDIPLFEGGRIDARIRRERARLSAARQRLRSLELQIQLDVETALSNLTSARQRVEVTQKAIRQAEESLRIERQKYELGKGSITDVLDAQSALLQTQTQYYRALADHSTASAQYRLAVGEKE